MRSKRILFWLFLPFVAGVLLLAYLLPSQKRYASLLQTSTAVLQLGDLASGWFEPTSPSNGLLAIKRSNQVTVIEINLQTGARITNAALAALLQEGVLTNAVIPMWRVSGDGDRVICYNDKDQVIKEMDLQTWNVILTVPLPEGARLAYLFWFPETRRWIAFNTGTNNIEGIISGEHSSPEHLRANWNFATFIGFYTETNILGLDVPVAD